MNTTSNAIYTDKTSRMVLLLGNLRILWQLFERELNISLPESHDILQDLHTAEQAMMSAHIASGKHLVHETYETFEQTLSIAQTHALTLKQENKLPPSAIGHMSTVLSHLRRVYAVTVEGQKN